MGVCALLAVVGAGGFFTVSALGRTTADTPTIVVDRSIGGIVIGMSQVEVETQYGSPDETLAITLRGGGAGLLARYHVHDGDLIVVYAGGQVVSIETDSAFYRTANGIGPGTSNSGLAGFHEDFCSLGLWNGGGSTPPDGIVTVFVPDGDIVGDVIITQLAYYDLCSSAGAGGEVPDPRPSSLDLTVDVVPYGAGWVRSSPWGIDCPLDCMQPFDRDTTVSLEAHPTSGFTFEGWSGACTGADTCVVTLDEAKSVVARFSGEYVPPKTTTTTPTTPTTTTTTTTTSSEDL